MRINGGGSSSPTIIIYALTETAIKKKVGISDALRDSSYVLSVIKLVLLVLRPKN